MALSPPAQSMTILKGAIKDSDGIDNPKDCETDFGTDDNMIDNEHFSLSKSFYTDWESCQISFSKRYYYFLQGLGSCGNPQPYFFDTSGVACDYVFPGTSDSLWCGTNGIPQSQIWSEETAGYIPNDIRCLGSMGSFTFNPGDVQELDIAFVFGRNFTDTNATAAIAVMQERIDSIRKYFVNDSTPCGLGFSGIAPSPKIIPQIKIFPNPTIGYITVETSGMLCDLKYELFDIIGRKIIQGTLKCTSANQIDVSNLDKGIYILNVSDGVNKFSRKFIKQ